VPCTPFFFASRHAEGWVCTFLKLYFFSALIFLHRFRISQHIRDERRWR
jgi:hypothetical protein